MPVVLVLALFACGEDPSWDPVPKQGEAPGPGEDLRGWSPPASCAEDVAPGSVEGFVRWPYLQHVTEGAATIAFGTAPGVTAGRVSLSVGGNWDAPDVVGETTARVIRLDDSDDDDLPVEEQGPVIEMGLHHVRITGLEPGTEYCYRVEVDGTVMASGLRFRTAPEDPTTPVRFLVIGDMGAGTPEQIEVRDAMLASGRDAQFMITTGDNAYSDGDRDELHEHVFVVYQELLARMPVYPTPGNHDYKTAEAQPYLDSFFLPEDAWREADVERYYTADFGPMHFIALDTETPAWQTTTSALDDQTDWLQGHAVVTERPWSVAGFHQPAKAGHPSRGPHLVALIQWVPILEAAGIPLVLQGHDHYYQRFAPTTQTASVPSDDGVRYIVSGGGGRALYPMDVEEPFLEVAEQRHHFLMGEADGCSLRLQAIDKTGAVFDELRLDRCD